MVFNRFEPDPCEGIANDLYDKVAEIEDLRKKLATAEARADSRRRLSESMNALVGDLMTQLAEVEAARAGRLREREDRQHLDAILQTLDDLANYRGNGIALMEHIEAHAKEMAALEDKHRAFLAFHDKLEEFDEVVNDGEFWEWLHAKGYRS